MGIYKGNKTKQISFPIGGIGTGSIGLAGNGRLVDWEIFNRPFKNSANGFTNIMVKAENKDEVIDTRVLQGDLLDHYTGGETVNIKRGNGGFGFGFGPYRGTMAGVPNFKECEFIGEFPFAKLHFKDKMFPGIISLTAFNPFIPLNDKDSSIPAAFFEIEVENTNPESLNYTIIFSLNNLLPYGTTVNQFNEIDNVRMIELYSDATDRNDLIYGNMCIATDSEDISYQEYWYRGEWFDSLRTYWTDVNKKGKLKNRTYTNHSKSVTGNDLDGEDVCSLASHIDLQPGEKKRVRYVISWNFPNCTNYWNPEKNVEKQAVWRNYYASLFNDAKDSAIYSLKNWDRLHQETKLFKEALYSTTLPDYCIEAVSANLSILKSPTCLRLEDGSFYGFEGCHSDAGCCEGSCTHVWNYAYALPFLFPNLERSMRDLDFKYNQRSDGAMSFRLQLPLGRAREDFRPCVDGQFGGVIKAYRDWKISGDSDWLRKNWDSIQKSIEYAWAETNEDKWDYDKDGVLEGRQHHTLDMELFGPSSWLNGFYLAALKAGAEIASLLGYENIANNYQDLYQRGKEWVDNNLFNGEYYEQKIDLTNKSLLENYNDGKPLVGKDAIDAYWNEEAGQIKYQIANGSSIDQVVAQWHANISGLGEIFDKDKTKSALEAIYKYNFKKSMRDEFNTGRIYSLNDEAGVKICAWPKDANKPAIPITYSDETMNGFEYQVAAHMVQEGMLEQGFEIVKAIRDRFDGEKRNPWNEFECGSNYARSMASYALIQAISGFEFNLVEKYIGFTPKNNSDRFCSFWSIGSGWGTVNISSNTVKIEVLYGNLTINKLKLGFLDERPARVTLNKMNLDFVRDNCNLKFLNDVLIREKEYIEISL